MTSYTEPSIRLTEEPPVAPKPSKPRERARYHGTVVPLGVEISAAHAEALAALCVKQRWSKRTTIEAAIEALAGQHGLWSPAPTIADSPQPTRKPKGGK